MKLLSASLLLVFLLTSYLLRYDITPAAVPLPGNRDVAVCVRLDRWTGAVDLGRQMTVGPETGPQMAAWVWEPVGMDLQKLSDTYRSTVEAK
jgi:hypothetical protein